MPIVAQSGHETIVFQFQMHNIATDEFQLSRQHATKGAIDRLGAIVPGGHIRVPTAEINSDGLTNVGYLPNMVYSKELSSCIYSQ